MSQVSVSFPLLVLFSVRLVYGFPGDNVMLMPQFEVRSVDPYLTQSSQPFTSQFQANRNIPQHVLNANVMHRRQTQAPVAEKSNNGSMTFVEFMEALNEVSQQSQHRGEEVQRLRTAGSTGRDDNQAYPTLPRPIGYSRPNYAPTSTYHETASPAPLTPPSSAEPKTPLKLDFSSILTPVATKATSKFSGLISLILSLLSGSSSDLQLTGLKGVLIEGIIKPLLVAKGGLKAVISKLCIPVIALLLINIEVLITVWWLWEECPERLPEPTPSTPAYSKPASYNSNYNSYR